jgi:hypothetical protein
VGLFAAAEERIEGTDLAVTGIDNPYWDLVKDRVDWTGARSLWRTPNVDGYRSTFVEDFIRAHEAGVDRHSLCKRYSWTIPDPETLAFVVEHSRGRLVDPMAGTGYWGWLLEQHGIDVAAYDIEPGTNSFHEGAPLYSTVEKLDGAEAVKLHTDRTLFLSWPPMDDVGARILHAYQGGRVIFIGESEGGCTGDDELFERLGKEWDEVAARVPVQWNGLHDVVTVYERSGGGR